MLAETEAKKNVTLQCAAVASLKFDVPPCVPLSG